MKIIVALSIALTCAAAGSLVAWRLHASRTHIINHYSGLLDPSVSYTEGCKGLEGVVEQLLHHPDASPGSTLTIFTLGSDETANEPQRLASYAIPISKKVIEGRHALVHQQDLILQDVEAKCGTVKSTYTSPIFLGVKQATSSLHAAGCGAGSHCELRVNTDGEENGELSIKNRLNNVRDDKHHLPDPVDNEGIEVVFCGVAATAGHILDPSGREIRKTPPRDPGHEDRLHQTWISLFTRPELVRFEPYCPSPTKSPGNGTAQAYNRAERPTLASKKER